MQGLSASLFRQGTYSTIRFGVYARLKEGTDPASKRSFSCNRRCVVCSKSASDRDHLLTKIWQASLAGVMGGMAGTPGDVANIRYVVKASNLSIHRSTLETVCRLTGRRNPTFGETTDMLVMLFRG